MVKVDKLRDSTRDKSRIQRLIKHIKVIKKKNPETKHIDLKTYKLNLLKKTPTSRPTSRPKSRSTSRPTSISTSRSKSIIQPDDITIPDMEVIESSTSSTSGSTNPITNNNYIIAIPSYNRPDIIQSNTLAVLKSHNINPSQITIFVSDKEQYDIYKNAIPSTLYNNIVIGALGLKNQRNYINSYYPEGTHVVEMDDDIKRIVQLVITKRNTKKGSTSSRMSSRMSKKTKSASRSTSIKSINDLDGFIKKAFTICTEKKIFLWGVYPLANAYFMTNTVTTDLRFIVGPMWGMINRHRKELKLTVDEKENSERTLQHWKLDRAVLRFNNVAIDTNYYKNKGGMQSEGKDRKLEAMKSIAYLHQLYPDITKIYMEKKSGMPEIKLLRTKKKM